MKKRKNIIIAVMVCAVLLMAIGYAYFATRLNINATGNITSNWNIYFSNITSGTIVGSASNNKTPSVTATTATMDANLALPGDSITYEITLTNGGTIGAIIEDIKAEATGSTAIIYTISGIKIGDKLAGGATKTITVKIEYDPNATSQPSETSKTLTVSIDAVQDVGQTIDSSDVVIEGEYGTFVRAILNNNIAQSDSNIDFSQPSSETNGEGLYYTTTNTEDNEKTYYFRGNIENNYVSFANHIWRIVRINEDGSIRIVTQDNIQDSVYNDVYDNAAVGFMYGATDANNYEDTHANTNDSDIKDVLDSWYTTNLNSFSSYLADAGFCNDRSVAPNGSKWEIYDTALGYAWEMTYYGAYNRLQNSDNPQFACPNADNDLFTLTTSTKGNKALINPIGLLTADEVVYAGGKMLDYNESYYLNNNDYWWTMTPAYFGSVGPYVWATYTYNNNSNIDVFAGETNGVRPVINLRADVEYTLEGTGDAGSSTNPYVIKVD